ncbi:MAG: acyltransferase [Myxococcota bacterium]
MRVLPHRLAKAALARWVYGPLVARRSNVVVKGKLRLRGRPLIDVVPNATLILGDGVLLNSDNDAYHVNMHSPVKLLADRPGAQIEIGAGSRIHGTCVHAAKSVRIGARCLIAANTHIIDSSGHDISFPNVESRIDSKDEARPVTIADDVWIGANCLIMPGVTIGEGTVIGAGSVVVKAIPSRVVAGGNPAKVIRDYAGR